MNLVALLALAAAASQLQRPPPPREAGLQPPMRFSCRLAAGGESREVAGTISRFYLVMPPGVGLMAVPVGDSYRDHIVVEVAPSAFAGLSGRYDLEARFPLDTDRMVIELPRSAAGGGYRLTFSPVRFGIGYQSFTSLAVDRTGSGPGGEPQTESWSGSCTTILPSSTARTPR